MANPPLSTEEQAAVASLSPSDIEAIDGVILSNCLSHWLKVARVVWDTEKALSGRYPGLSYIFYAQRLIQLVEQGRIESQGNLQYMRFSEVRLPQ